MFSASTVIPNIHFEFSDIVRVVERKPEGFYAHLKYKSKSRRKHKDFDKKHTVQYYPTKKEIDIGKLVERIFLYLIFSCSRFHLAM